MLLAYLLELGVDFWEELGKNGADMGFQGVLDLSGCDHGTHTREAFDL
jgi:hypothetical protein